jgi:hypothetical protein
VTGIKKRSWTIVELKQKKYVKGMRTKSDLSRPNAGGQ